MAPCLLSQAHETTIEGAETVRSNEPAHDETERNTHSTLNDSSKEISNDASFDPSHPSISYGRKECIMIKAPIEKWRRNHRNTTTKGSGPSSYESSNKDLHPPPTNQLTNTFITLSGNGFQCPVSTMSKAKSIQT